MKYGSDLLQLVMNALPIGARVVTLNIHAYGGEKGSGTDTSLEAFSDQQRLLGTEEITVTDQFPLGEGKRTAGDKLLTQIRNGFALTEGPESDEEVAISTRFGVSFKDVADLHGDLPEGNYFLPVLDMLCKPESFYGTLANLRAGVTLGHHDAVLEFLRKYRFTVMDTGKSLHLVGSLMIPNEYRAQEKFLAQALMFPSLGVDTAWCGHSLFRQWMGLRISANGDHHTKVPTINTDLTAQLQLLQNDQIGQANPGASGELSGVAGLGF